MIGFEVSFLLYNFFLSAPAFCLKELKTTLSTKFRFVSSTTGSSGSRKSLRSTLYRWSLTFSTCSSISSCFTSSCAGVRYQSTFWAKSSIIWHVWAKASCSFINGASLFTSYGLLKMLSPLSSNSSNVASVWAISLRVSSSAAAMFSILVALGHGWLKKPNALHVENRSNLTASPARNALIGAGTESWLSRGFKTEDSATSPEPLLVCLRKLVMCLKRTKKKLNLMKTTKSGNKRITILRHRRMTSSSFKT